MPAAAKPLDRVLVHLIDPEMCIRCNTCEETCPLNAISHDARNYVVDPNRCNACRQCVEPCPTGAINHWRTVPRGAAYAIEEQLTWDALPVQQAGLEDPPAGPACGAPGPGLPTPTPSAPVAAVAPASASRPVTHLYGPHAPVQARVEVNRRLVAADSGTEVHHLVLSMGEQPFPVLEGQNLGILPPGLDAHGRPHFMRAYSIASCRDGESPGDANVALTVKRVTSDRAGHPVRGVASNHLCDLPVGATVQVVGPLGDSFLMPDDPHTDLVMICTGTGIAPMRGFIERRRRLGIPGGQMTLLYGGRRPQEMPYHDELMALPEALLTRHFAYSRSPDHPKQHVQDLIAAQADTWATLLTRDNTYFYVCGLKDMASGIEHSLQQLCAQRGMRWATHQQGLIASGRWHQEIY